MESLPQLLTTALIALTAGAALGWLYFQSLWASVRRLARQRRPGVSTTASLLVRFTAAFAVLLLIVRWGDWPALVMTLIGFLISRTLTVRYILSTESKTETPL